MKKRKGGRGGRPVMVEGLESRVHLSVARASAGGSGAVSTPVDSAPPNASRYGAEGWDYTLTAPNNSFGFKVTYHDASRIDAGTLDDHDVLVTGPNGFWTYARLVSQERGKHGSTRRAYYAAYGPNGGWSADDNGSYTLQLIAGSVGDVNGNAVGAVDLGTQVVEIPRRKGTRTLRQETGPAAAARQSVAVTAVDDLVLIAGGALSTFPYDSDVVDVYDGANDTWSSLRLPGPARRDITAVTTGHSAVFAGGWTSGGPTDWVDVYDASAGQWSHTTLPRAASELTAAAVGTKAIFVDHGSYGVNDSAAYIYDTADGTWTTVALPSGCTMAVAVNSTVLFPGSTYDTPKGYRVNDEVAVYDDRTGAWSTTRAPASLYDGEDVVTGVATVGELAVIVRGSSLQMYDVTTGRWSTVGTYVEPTSVLAVGSRIVVADAKDVEVYDTATAQRSRGTLSLRRDSFALAALGSKVMFIGGSYADVDRPGEPTAVVDVYDVARDRWSVTRLSQHRSGGAVAAVRDRLIVAGGWLGNPEPGSDAADVLIDGAATAVLGGSVALDAGGTSATVTIRNTGDAPVAGPFPVEVYAAREGRRSVLLGSAAVATPLAVGASIRVSVPLRVPDELDLAEFRLAAAAGAGRRAGAFATCMGSAVPLGRLVDAPDVSQPQKFYRFAVRYEGPFPIDNVWIDYRDVVVTGPNGFSAFADVVSQRLDATGPRTVAYELRGPGGWWDAAANGTYVVHLQGEQVRDVAGNAAAGGPVGDVPSVDFGDEHGARGACVTIMRRRNSRGRRRPSRRWRPVACKSVRQASACSGTGCSRSP